MCKSSFINSVSFVFCEFNRAASWKEGKTIIWIRSFQFQNWKTLDSYSRSTNVNINMYFPDNKFWRKHYYLCIWEDFWHYQELKNDCWTSRHIFCEKNIILFRMCGGLYSCRKVKYIWISHFPEVITTNMQIGNEFFVFKYTVRLKKISKFTIFYWN